MISTKYGRVSLLSDDSASATKSFSSPVNEATPDLLRIYPVVKSKTILRSEQWTQLVFSIVTSAIVVVALYYVRIAFLITTEKLFTSTYYLLTLVVAILCTHYLSGSFFQSDIPWHLFATIAVWTACTLYDTTSESETVQKEKIEPLSNIDSVDEDDAHEDDNTEVFKIPQSTRLSDLVSKPVMASSSQLSQTRKLGNNPFTNNYIDQTNYEFVGDQSNFLGDRF